MKFIDADVLSASFKTFNNGFVSINPSELADENITEKSVDESVKRLIENEFIIPENDCYKVNLRKIVEEFEQNGCRFNITVNRETSERLATMFYDSCELIDRFTYNELWRVYSVWTRTHDVVAIFCV